MAQSRKPRYTKPTTFTAPRARRELAWFPDPRGAWALTKGGPCLFNDLNDAHAYMEARGLKSMKVYWVWGGSVAPFTARHEVRFPGDPAPP